MDNTNKNPIFSIKNFRSFGEDGADFELTPITVLTGCNSAGKSSLVKALLLLSKTDENEIGGELSRKTPSTIFPVSIQELALGKFDNVLNKKSNNRSIEMSYTIWSNCLQEEVRVKRNFISKKNDVMNNGELLFYTIEKIDGTTIYNYEGATDIDGGKFQFNIIEKNYKMFLSAVDYYNIKHFLEIADEMNDKTILEGSEKEIQDMRIKLVNLKEKFASLSEEKFGDTIKIWNDVIKVRQDELSSLLGRMSGLDDTSREKIINKFNEDDEEKNKILFETMIVNETLRPAFIKNVNYADSSSATVRRLYTTEENNKIGEAFRELLSKEMSYRDASDEGIIFSNSPGHFLRKWIEKFGVGYGIKIQGTDQGTGILVYLIKNGEKILLADEGYGITQLVALVLNIDNNIPLEPDGDYDVKTGEMSYIPKYICVEEPENHLHPKFQSLLAEMFVEAYQKYNIHFIIETHSEYLIRKLQVMVADKENALTSNDVSLNYVEKNEEGISHNRQIKIKEDGRLDGSFGEGFYDEAGNLSRIILKMSD